MRDYILPDYKGDVIKIGGVCYQFNGFTKDGDIDSVASALPAYQTCADCLTDTSSAMLESSPYDFSSPVQEAGAAPTEAFDIGSGYITMDSTPSWGTFSEITLAARFRWDTATSFVAWYRPSSGTVQHIWWDRDSTKIRIITHHPGVGDVRMYTGSLGWDDDTWRQLVFRWKGSTNTAQLWLSDGTNMYTESSSTSWPSAAISAPTSAPRIGTVDGLIDHICLYSSYKDPADFYASGCFKEPPSGALFHYVGGLSTLTDVPDQSGNSQDATAQSGVSLVSYNGCP